MSFKGKCDGEKGDGKKDDVSPFYPAVLKGSTGEKGEKTIFNPLVLGLRNGVRRHAHRHVRAVFARRPAARKLLLLKKASRVRDSP